MTIPIAPAIIGPGSNQQNVTNLPASGTPVFVYDTACGQLRHDCRQAVAAESRRFTRTSATLAMVDLPLPGGTDRAYRAASKKSGKSLRVIRDYVALSDQFISSA